MKRPPLLLLIGIILLFFSGCKVWIGDYYIHSSGDVKRLSDWKCKRITGSLIIEYTSLTSLEGLENLYDIGKLDIYDNGSLTSLEGLNNLESVGDVRIVLNPALTNLERLNSISSLQGIELDDNDSLTNLEGLNNLTSLNGILLISHNDGLQNIEALNNLEYVYALSIFNNLALTSLEGLSALTTIGEGRPWPTEKLYIVDNDALTNLGLSSLNFVSDDFIIQENSELCNDLAEALEVQVQDGSGIGGTIEISDNKDCSAP